MCEGKSFQRHISDRKGVTSNGRKSDSRNGQTDSGDVPWIRNCGA